MLNPALEPRHNWRILLQLRALAIMGQGAAVLVLFLFFEFSSDIALIAAIIAIYALINSVLWVQLKTPTLPGQRSYLFQLLLDVFELSILFYFTGGTDNPFIFYYLVPISIAATILPFRYICILTASFVVAFSLLSIFNRPLPEFEETHMNIMIGHIALWFNFVMCAIFITAFVSHIVGHMQKKHHWLAHSREHLLQDEQILAIATHAAGTAHELSSPLTSMKLIVEELLLETKDNAFLNQDVTQLKQQIDQCSIILRKLSKEAQVNSQWHNKATAAIPYLEKVLDKWLILRPDVQMDLQILGEHSPDIRIDPTLDQALLNLLNNAADANPENIQLTCQWDDKTLTLKIRDHGPGISNTVLERLGRELTTTKDGMGIGFFLSNASIARRGGTVALYPVDTGGTLTEITIPIETSVNK